MISPSRQAGPLNSAEESVNGADERLAQLRGLLIGPEQAQIEALRRRLDDPEARTRT